MKKMIFSWSGKASHLKNLLKAQSEVDEYNKRTPDYKYHKFQEKIQELGIEFEDKFYNDLFSAEDCETRREILNKAGFDLYDELEKYQEHIV